MKSNPGRRSFLKKIGVGTAATLVPGQLLSTDIQSNGHQDHAAGSLPESSHRYNEAYTGDYLRRVAFPVGGMGAGMFCLEGTGAFSHMSVRHRPEIFHEPGMFAALSIKGISNGTKVVEGPCPDWKKFGQPDSGNGSGGSIFGLPRFHQASFLPRFPFASIQLEDEDLPLKVAIDGWSPFIPTDADNSSLPVGAVEYQFVNTGSDSLDAVFSFNSRNFMVVDKATGSIRKMDRGFVLACAEADNRPSARGDFAIFTDQPDTIVDHCWFRGGWFDPLTMAWEVIRKGETKAVEPVESGAPGASLFVPFTLAPAATKSIRVMFAWYVPTSDLRIGTDASADEACDLATGCCDTTDELGLKGEEKLYTGAVYKPWYSNKFWDVNKVAGYFVKNYDELRRKSALFRDAFFSSTLPPEVLEAVSANLTILKSPTVLRQFDGRLWNFEGCSDNEGCCHGSCTHVWNYAQAIPHLFPSLERTLRHTEFCEDQSAQGHQTFRAALPIRRVKHDFYAAADGQLGGIMKVYREWRISGDNEWLAKMYPMTKLSMDYCIRTWDPRSRGVIEEPHHNTYDIEFWGPDGMCTSFYLGALNAMIRMGTHLKKDVKVYQRLLAAGKQVMESELFNGEYFIQKIQTTGLLSKSPADPSSKSFGGGYSAEAKDLLEKEGPKYQYGSGCLSDGVLGGWIAHMCGLEEVLDPAKTKSHLMAVYKYNLKKNLSDHANPQRPSYAMGDEGGLLLCTWPKGGRLSLPFVYSDEVWTGIEYQVASHLMLTGNVNEGLDIVRTCRDRYDGRSRNPFNEYECGHWYARALSSYGLLEGLTGLRYDAVDKALHIHSKVGDFKCFISTATGFGTVSLIKGKPSVETVFGEIKLTKTFVDGKQVS